MSDVKLSKQFITAVAKEAVFGKGLPVGAPVTATFTGGADQDVILSTNPVQEATIVVTNTTTSVVLRKDVHYTVVVTAGETKVVLKDGVAGLKATDDVSIVFGVWTDSDLIQADTGSYITTAFEELERDVANGSLENCPSILGTETVSGTITADILINDSDQFDSHTLIEAGMGKYIAGGATLFASTQSTIPNPFSTDYEVTLYRALSAADIEVYVGTDRTGTKLDITTDYTVSYANGVATVTILEAGGTVVAGDNIFVCSPNSFAVSEVATLTGEASLYRFRKLGEDRISLTARQYIGGDVDSVRDSLGLVVDSINFNLPTGQLAKLEMSISGIKQLAASEGQAPLSIIDCVGDPFSVKDAVFLVDGVAVADVTDLSFTAENTIADVSGVESAGTSNKVETMKMFTGTYNTTFRSNEAFRKYVANTKASIYMQLTNTAGDSLTLFLPNIRYTANELTDTDGLAYENLTCKAFRDELGVSAYIAVKYRS